MNIVEADLGEQFNEADRHRQPDLPGDEKGHNNGVQGASCPPRQRLDYAPIMFLFHQNVLVAPRKLKLITTMSIDIRLFIFNAIVRDSTEYLTNSIVICTLGL